MEVLRKSLKAYLIAVALFTLLTFILAAIISFTGFRENWAFGGLIVSLTLACMVIGFLEGKIVGKRGLITGVISSLILLVIILISVRGAFSDSFNMSGLSLFYLIPLAGGAVGGIIGVSGEKN
ncbi:MAG: TIGR04086 family membrane protein [Anaerovoracaceae bacterium]